MECLQHERVRIFQNKTSIERQSFMRIREVRHQATTLAEAVSDIRIGVLVKRQNNLWKEVNTAFFKAMALNGIVRRLVLLSPHQFIYINSIFHAPYLYFMFLILWVLIKHSLCEHLEQVSRLLNLKRYFNAC